MNPSAFMAVLKIKNHRTGLNKQKRKIVFQYFTTRHPGGERNIFIIPQKD
jgi:hypothetical protein